MTDFEKIKGYYSVFNEDERLSNSPSGRLEYENTVKILRKHLPESGTILDLGGATGVYSFPLAQAGYKVYLADLSEALINKAREKVQRTGCKNLISCDVVNAVDLSIYKDNSFDVVLVMGPMYHLLEESERIACVKEVNRVLKTGGTVFAAFLPYLSGSIGVVDRFWGHPEQVNRENLKEVFASGRFKNARNSGFQEGYYPSSDEFVKLFSDEGFEKISLRSIRGFGYERERMIYASENTEMIKEIMDIIDRTSEMKEIVETCGHAMYVGRKK